MNVAKKLLPPALLAAVISAIGYASFNRHLESACALPPRTQRQQQFKRLPLPLELIYVTAGISAAIARTIRKTLT